MRLDKYLKVARIIKRRPLAKEICDQGRVQLNGKTARASAPVSIKDEITIQLGQKQLTIRVDQIQENVRKEDAGSLYTILQEERIDS